MYNLIQVVSRYKKSTQIAFKFWLNDSFLAKQKSDSKSQSQIVRELEGGREQRALRMNINKKIALDYHGVFFETSKQPIATKHFQMSLRRWTVSIDNLVVVT